MPPNTSEGKEGKKGHLLNCFCFCSHSFQTDTPEFMYWVLTFHFFLCMNTLTGNKCLFPHLLHCWHTRKHNLCIFKHSYFQLISTSLFGSWHHQSFEHVWYFEVYLENLLLVFSCQKSENWFTQDKFQAIQFW